MLMLRASLIGLHFHGICFENSLLTGAYNEYKTETELSGVAVTL
jgi:hypothetical protein